ncbi:major capsid protein [Paenibacillus alvei]|uniref:major capsid protein n=1 Tax=Paenibacillus alvei TaxID=44250 RepID=UPI0018CF4E59|nr:phage capsid protein [Paenibacillus alvei]MBG9737097.1 phage capsid protein [Paenibacillus alvei]MBG9742793.1 phage capsid protein [Paenibacillus alvei]MBG9746190.1 phage capsid protein [Paenibacillus alvei]MCY9579702.1 phage capsid protein [Paenibacillus alvei]MCY9586355.1 phage capsid protein [Paenibacillus alvei]
MAVTLSEAKKNVQDALTMGVIDEFRKNNFLLDNLTFDDAVSPTGGGATLTYGYTRLITQPTAAFRAVNEEYTPQEVTKQRHNVDLKIFGGTFQIDRIIAGMGGIVSEVQLQLEQKVKAAQALFNDTVINGDSAVEAKAFDGLEKALTGSSTEYLPTDAIDLSTSEAVDKNYKVFLDQLDEFLMGLDGTPSGIMGNLKLIAKIRACARRAGMYTISRDEFGRQVEKYNETPLVDLGAKAGTNDPVIATKASGETSLFAVRLGLDGFHGVSMAGQPPVRTWLPDYTTSGAVKTGEVEMVAAVALKATKAAGVMRKIKVS